MDTINNIVASIGISSKIVKHEGNDGLLQVTLNSLNANKELYIYETSYASLNKFFEQEKAEEIRTEFLKNGIKIYQLTNRAFHEDYTNVKGFHEIVNEVRYVDPIKLTINCEMLIYNDVVCFYTVTGKKYAVEIYNADLAHMQKQIFEFVWKTGEKPIVGKNGRSSLI